jgi:hypothetical protein
MELIIEELLKHVKRWTPQPKALIELKGHEKGNYVSFRWNSKEFIVKTNLEVMEMKNKTKLFITASSQLMQAALLSGNKSPNEKKLEMVIASIEEIEGMLRDVSKHAKGIKQLQSVKKTMANMIPKAA